MPVVSPPVELLACPRCKSDLLVRAGGIACADVRCEFHSNVFPEIDNRPVLVDFDQSILDKRQTLSSEGASPLIARKGYRSKLKAFIDRLQRARRYDCFDVGRFLSAAKELKEKPTILVIGGGAVRGDAKMIYDDPTVHLVGTDIYLTPHVSLIADGHQLPFRSSTIDAVWIQAVLEHVIEPAKVVEEIHRVLVPNGLVYAETPFMQQVHEGAWDFTRFSLSGHRWLFRQFSEVSSGVVAGPATTLIWAIRYFASSLTGSHRFGYRVGLFFFWLKYFESIAKPKMAIDGASCVYFFGRRSERALHVKEMVSYYKGGV